MLAALLSIAFAAPPKLELAQVHHITEAQLHSESRREVAKLRFGQTQYSMRCRIKDKLKCILRSGDTVVATVKPAKLQLPGAAVFRVDVSPDNADRFGGQTQLRVEIPKASLVDTDFVFGVSAGRFAAP